MTGTAAHPNTTSAVTRAFEVARAEGRVALVPYVMAGWPTSDEAVEIALALIEAGADVLEVGMPFSDPLADGPTIQRVGTESLAGGTTTDTCLATVRRIRERAATPIVLMGYCNPVLRYGVDRFCTAAAGAGANGLIVADLPPEEADELLAACQATGLDLVFLVAPTSSDERIAQVSATGSGFLYCVSLTGTTGVRTSLWQGLPAFLARVRANSQLPVVVGFGISTAEHVRQVVAHGGDGVVVASALLDRIGQAQPADRPATAAAYLRDLAAGTLR